MPGLVRQHMHMQYTCMCVLHMQYVAAVCMSAPIDVPMLCAGLVAFSTAAAAAAAGGLLEGVRVDGSLVFGPPPESAPEVIPAGVNFFDPSNGISGPPGAGLLGVPSGVGNSLSNVGVPVTAGTEFEWQACISNPNPFQNPVQYSIAMKLDTTGLVTLEQFAATSGDTQPYTIKLSSPTFASTRLKGSVAQTDGFGTTWTLLANTLTISATADQFQRSQDCFGGA